MRSWIHHTKGRHVRQARIGLGDLREEHISRQGFFGPVAMIYREHGPPMKSFASKAACIRVVSQIPRGSSRPT
ncbi:MAG TPA: hypothetical protein VKI44_21980 [Acetobacteraceae bacterium]|nr:hypothetical protein [Acetobacteraceae bacterium]